MLEIEVKVPVNDLAEVESAIVAGGGIASERKRQVDVYFAHPCRDFGRTDEALRLRLDGGRQKLTYKGPKIDTRSKTREEVEFAAPFEEMRTVLLRLGFTEFIKVEKERSDYRWEGIVISLDRVLGLGDFVELEVEGEDLEQGLVRIEKMKARLGIQGNETRSYLELLLKKREL